MIFFNKIKTQAYKTLIEAKTAWLSSKEYQDWLKTRENKKDFSVFSSRRPLSGSKEIVNNALKENRKQKKVKKKADNRLSIKPKKEKVFKAPSKFTHFEIMHIRSSIHRKETHIRKLKKVLKTSKNRKKSHDKINKEIKTLLDKIEQQEKTLDFRPASR